MSEKSQQFYEKLLGETEQKLDPDVWYINTFYKMLGTDF